MTFTPYQALQNQVGWALGILSILAVGARVYCRCVATRSFALDDGFMVMALVAGIITSALISAAVSHGYGLHLRDITDPHDREQTLMLTFIAPSVSVVASTLGKISMMLFLVRILGPSAKKGHLWLLYGVTVIMIGLNIFMIGIFPGQCTPMEKSWKPEIPGSCVSDAVWDYGARIQAGWNAFMDLLTAAFPIYMVWTMHMKTSTKWGLSALMAGGLCAAAATFAKIWYLRNMTKLDDVTYAWAPISICYVTDVFVLIIAGSIPTLRPVIRFCSDARPGKRRFFAAFRNNEEPSSQSRYDGTTMAGSMGWELPERIEVRISNERKDSLELTALPQYNAGPGLPFAPLHGSVPVSRTARAGKGSRGSITIHRDFNLTYEDDKQGDEKDLESGRKP